MKRLSVDFINISPNGVVYTVTESDNGFGNLDFEGIRI